MRLAARAVQQAHTVIAAAAHSSVESDPLQAAAAASSTLEISRSLASGGIACTTLGVRLRAAAASFDCDAAAASAGGQKGFHEVGTASGSADSTSGARGPTHSPSCSHKNGGGSGSGGGSGNSSGSGRGGNSHNCGSNGGCCCGLGSGSGRDRSHGNLLGDLTDGSGRAFSRSAGATVQGAEGGTCTVDAGPSGSDGATQTVAAPVEFETASVAVHRSSLAGGCRRISVNSLTSAATACVEAAAAAAAAASEKRLQLNLLRLKSNSSLLMTGSDIRVLLQWRQEDVLLYEQHELLRQIHERILRLQHGRRQRLHAQERMQEQRDSFLPHILLLDSPVAVLSPVKEAAAAAAAVDQRQQQLRRCREYRMLHSFAVQQLLQLLLLLGLPQFAAKLALADLFEEAGLCALGAIGQRRLEEWEAAHAIVAAAVAAAVTATEKTAGICPRDALATGPLNGREEGSTEAAPNSSSSCSTSSAPAAAAVKPPRNASDMAAAATAAAAAAATQFGGWNGSWFMPESAAAAAATAAAQAEIAGLTEAARTAALSAASEGAVLRCCATAARLAAAELGGGTGGKAFNNSKLTLPLMLSRVSYVHYHSLPLSAPSDWMSLQDVAHLVSNCNFHVGIGSSRVLVASYGDVVSAFLSNSGSGEYSRAIFYTGRNGRIAAAVVLLTRGARHETSTGASLCFVQKL